MDTWSPTIPAPRASRTNAQHSFFQLLHQRTDDVGSDIILAARPTSSDRQSGGQIDDQHDVLVAHALAQASFYPLA